MQAALALARRGLGRVWPNPAVGCVLTRDDVVIGRGWTQPGGRPHAETEAIARAGDAKGATAYVTLEPCSHHGQTAPCADALVSAGVRRVVAAMEDPDPRVNGRGFDILRQAGIDVEVGMCRDEAVALNRGFVKRLVENRPMVTLKMAITSDGRIATGSGESQWITGDESRADVHRLRAEHDAIVVASATAIADDPMLTCRLPGMSDRSPVRILLDARLRVPTDTALYRTAAELPLWVFAAAAPEGAASAARAALGARMFTVSADRSGQGVNLYETFGLLADQGLTRVLVEAGGALASALLIEKLVDELVLYRAPSLIGGDGIAMTGPLGVEKLAGRLNMQRIALRTIGNEVVETFRL
jgi:diaminohydroxyphosphoribosylaminopyrimidine deaminase/5-amino-6-(5-phosphoribosylamino)uracil reductase